MKLQKTAVKSKSASIKLTEMENQKLETLAKNRGMKKSTLIRELVKIGFNQVTKKEL
jgi:predicted DNA-binding protein